MASKTSSGNVIVEESVCNCGEPIYKNLGGYWRHFIGDMPWCPKYTAAPTQPKPATTQGDESDDKWKEVYEQCTAFLANPGEPSTKPIEWCVQLIEELREMREPKPAPQDEGFITCPDCGIAIDRANNELHTLKQIIANKEAAQSPLLQKIAQLEASVNQLAGDVRAAVSDYNDELNKRRELEEKLGKLEENIKDGR